MTPSGFRLQRKDWDSDFFAREIYSLDLGDAVDLPNLMAALAALDERHVWGVECHVDMVRFEQASFIEEAGFRVVDSRMTFISEMSREQVPEPTFPYGVARTVEGRDLDRIAELTTECLVDNGQFHSRYKDIRLFTRDESIRYFNAWNERASRDHPDLFIVWEVDDGVVAYFTYLAGGTVESTPLFKGGLTAVDPRHRGHGVHNALQYVAFSRFGVDRWYLDNSTQMTNTAAIKNHMRANKSYRGAALTFYRVKGGFV